MFRQKKRIFGMMWYNVWLLLQFLAVFGCFFNIQNQSAAGNVIQLNKKKPNAKNKKCGLKDKKRLHIKKEFNNPTS